ncbi:MAG: SusD/RagB family nutrient-binding outer membrane lipoprotein [Saprospiraceae bacterium]|nr:SusD/RagB family nutrient-binding outer membrane lipoprotein [Saprospiraceae bacterium]
MFKGNNSKWVKFANSLKLRILVHQSRIAGRVGYLTTELNKINSEGSGFITRRRCSCWWTIFFVATTGKLNPAYDDGLIVLAELYVDRRDTQDQQNFI